MAKDRLDRIEEILDRVAKEQEKFAKEIMELKESQKRTDEQIRKTDEQIKKTDEQIKKTDEQIKKTDEQLKKTSAELKDLIGIQRETTRRLDDTVSRFTEGLLQPSAERFFKKLGFNVLEIHKRTSRMKKSTRERLEIDILCLGKVEKKNGVGLDVGKQVAFVIEAKSSLEQEYVKPFVNNQIERFKEFFTEYSEYVVIGGIGGINVEEEAKEKAEEEGLYIFYPADDNLIVINSPNFKPKIWD